MKAAVAALALGLAAGCAPPAMEWTRVTAVAVADLDGDGLQDLLAAKVLAGNGPRPFPGYLAVALQDAARPGTFLPSRETRLPGAEPGSLAVADLDGDGRPDVATGDGGSGSISILLQDPQRPGTLVASGSIALGEAPAGLAAADLDGDGRVDLAAGASDGVWVVRHAPGPAEFLAPSKLALPAALGPRAAVAAADLDGDGLADLVAVDLGTWDPATGTAAGGGVSVFLGDPVLPGGFLAPLTTPVAEGQQPVAVAAGDLDGDGRPDLAVASFGIPSDPSSARLWVLPADPAAPGRFLAPVAYRAGERAWEVALADLDGDGRLDAAVSDVGTTRWLARSDDMGVFTEQICAVSVLRQDPAIPGAFRRAVEYRRRGSQAGLALGDLDGDGRPDVAIADTGLPVQFQDPGTPGAFLPAAWAESASGLPY